MPDENAPPTVRPLPAPLRWALLALAVCALALGVVGIFLPVLPTVPFVLLAAWAAGLSSPRLQRWLESHPRLGPPIADWRRGGVVPRRAKRLATVMMSASGAFMLWRFGLRWHVFAAIGTMAAVAVWLWLRPESLPADLLSKE